MVYTLTRPEADGKPHGFLIDAQCSMGCPDSTPLMGGEQS